MDKELLKVCEKCGLSKSRNNVVIPKGEIDSDVMFIGEAPGKNEDKEGLPFVGRAGKWFDEIISILGIQNYYVTNTVKCNPKDINNRNRPPSDYEMKMCSDWLRDEIKEIKPKIGVLMGGTALKAFFPDTKLKNVVGEEVLGHSITDNLGTRLFVLYHPAVLIYNEKYFKPLYKEHLNGLKRLITEETGGSV